MIVVKHVKLNVLLIQVLVNLVSFKPVRALHVRHMIVKQVSANHIQQQKKDAKVVNPVLLAKYNLVKGVKIVKCFLAN
jgi:hypothetical protein